MSDTKKKRESFFATMSLGDHLEELRIRIIYALIGLAVATIVGFYFGSTIIKFIEQPYIDAMEPGARLQSLAPADGFMSYMKISIITGVVISSPWIFYHLWMFVSAGLYQNERKYIHIAIPFSTVLFIAGALFFILVVAPLTLSFLVKFNKAVLGVSSNSHLNTMSHLSQR